MCRAWGVALGAGQQWTSRCEMVCTYMSSLRLEIRENWNPRSEKLMILKSKPSEPLSLQPRTLPCWQAEYARRSLGSLTRVCLRFSFWTFCWVFCRACV